MRNFYLCRRACVTTQHLATAGLLLCLWLIAATGQAQAPAWTLATTGTSVSTNNPSITYALVADASGNLFVAGTFRGSVSFGATTLTSAGQSDLFVAKYVPATNTWAWAVRGGGTENDAAYGLAVQGNSVYITGNLLNNAGNSYQVTLSSSSTGPGSVPVAGAGSTTSTDILVAKYTDQGTSAALAWVQVAGGKANDSGYGIAATSTGVYVTGTLYNDAANSQAVLFGGTGSTPGTWGQVGATTTFSSDLVLAKYLDNGASATVAWTQVAGGTSGDGGSAVAVRGSSIYVAGSIANTLSDANSVRFGGSNTAPGTLAQAGAAPTLSSDLVVAKYLEDGTTATVVWTQVGGGTDDDLANSVAISGSNVYVTGALYNDTNNSNRVLFGGAGLVPGSAPQYGASATAGRDLVLAKYTDNGSSATLGWTQVGGGTSYDAGLGVAASGSSVYVTGWLINNAANSNNVLLGGSGSTLGTVTQPGISNLVRGAADIFVAKYNDLGSAATIGWTQLAGGPIDDRSQAIALSGTTLYVAGAACSPTIFGTLTITSSPGLACHFLAGLAGAVLAATPGTAAALPRLYPNPAPGPATLSGAVAGAAVSVFDPLGRRVATATADAQGTAALPGGLAPGLYLVRAGAATVRWAVE